MVIHRVHVLGFFFFKYFSSSFYSNNVIVKINIKYIYNNNNHSVSYRRPDPSCLNDIDCQDGVTWCDSVTAAALHSLKMIGLGRITFNRREREKNSTTQSQTHTMKAPLYTEREREKNTFIPSILLFGLLYIGALVSTCWRRSWKRTFRLFFSFFSFPDVIDWPSISRLPRSWETCTTLLSLSPPRTAAAAGSDRSLFLFSAQPL